MKLLDIECSWCKEILKDGLMLDSVELGCTYSQPANGMSTEDTLWKIRD
jgi:hypothetical protein